ncbi:MAG: SDR family NAD(P)-dependent oxidoreductase, partial [Rubrivivax sp.]|nr:SDR family NAD(P)-dependent oxidoreductase [Rubrivivax sp.]
MKLFDLSGRTALITGSSKGIGYAIAGALASAGARVVLNARSPDALAQARNTLAAEGFDVHTAAYDVTDADAVEAGVLQVEAQV